MYFIKNSCKAETCLIKTACSDEALTDVLQVTQCETLANDHPTFSSHIKTLRVDGKNHIKLDGLGHLYKTYQVYNFY